MFQQLGVEILGVIENMSCFVCEHGARYDIFGRGGARTMAETMGLPFLGEIPIDMSIRVHSDNGDPYENFKAGVTGEHLGEIVRALAEQVKVRGTKGPAARPVNLQVS